MYRSANAEHGYRSMGRIGSSYDNTLAAYPRANTISQPTLPVNGIPVACATLAWRPTGDLDVLESAAWPHEEGGS